MAMTTQSMNKAPTEEPEMDEGFEFIRDDKGNLSLVEKKAKKVEAKKVEVKPIVTKKKGKK